MRSRAKHYDELRDWAERTPLIDCHDHTSVAGPKYTDPIHVVTGGYFNSDLLSVMPGADFARVQDSSLSLDERWPLLEAAWKRTCHTGYAQVTRRVLKKFYGEERLTLEALKRMQGKLLNLEDESVFIGILDDAGIKVRIADLFLGELGLLKEGYTPPPRARLAISLPAYHGVRSQQDIQERVGPLNRRVTSLGEYVDACRELFTRLRDKGTVAFKDQSAYTRPINYGNPTRAEAEAVFNWLLDDPRRSAEYPEGLRPLDDFLFHEFMRIARDLDLPVQIHTGHMAGIRNNIVKTNAVGLTHVLELHHQVRFDLFHANWPYSGELLFLCKNYPNVTIDFCWANIIAPIYCQNMLKQILSSVPHGKIHGYGSDYVGAADRAWAHASIARDNIAMALADMVEIEYLGLDEAKQVLREWLFDNPNRFFRLGLKAS